MEELSDRPSSFSIESCSFAGDRRNRDNLNRSVVSLSIGTGSDVRDADSICWSDSGRRVS